MFHRYVKGKPEIRKVGLDCQKAIEEGRDIILVEQAHRETSDINYIINKHGIDLIQQTSLLRSSEFRFDDVTGNDFTEAMFIVTKAQQQFDQMPSKIKKRFNYDAAEFLDFVQNPKNSEALVEMGLANKKEQVKPQKVEVVNYDQKNGNSNKEMVTGESNKEAGKENSKV